MSLEPGIYRATVRGVPDQIVMVHDSAPANSVCTVGRVGDLSMHSLDNITDARPLVVLEVPEGGEGHHHYRRLAAYLRRGGWEFTADLIEAQVRPPRIPEPGLWGVVEASHPIVNSARIQFVHRSGGWHGSSGGWEAWSDLIDPVLIRPGVTQ